jgi:Squalene-hopene cyclase C-terminal domain
MMLKKSAPVINWLVEENQPSIRSLTLTELLGRPKKDPEVKAAKNSLTSIGWAKEILEKQAPEGYWVRERSLFQPKYISTFWMLLILADLGLTKEDPRVEKAAQMWLERCRTRDGGFGMTGNAKEGHLCITGNTARAMVKLGYSDHSKVRGAFKWLVEHQADRGGWSCWNFAGRHTQRDLDSWEPLSAFAVYPRQKWTHSMKNAVERGAEFYLERELHRLPKGESYRPWYRFHYPNHYYYDLLVGLDVLTALGYSKDKRLGYAISLFKEKRRPDGRWNLDALNPDPESGQGKWDREHPEKATVHFGLEKEGAPSKMITFTALKILNRIGEV